MIVDLENVQVCNSFFEVILMLASKSYFMDRLYLNIDKEVFQLMINFLLCVFPS